MFQTKAVYFSNTSKSHVPSVEGGQAALVDLIGLAVYIVGQLTTNVGCKWSFSAIAFPYQALLAMHQNFYIIRY